MTWICTSQDNTLTSGDSWPESPPLHQVSSTNGKQNEKKRYMWLPWTLARGLIGVFIRLQILSSGETAKNFRLPSWKQFTTNQMRFCTCYFFKYKLRSKGSVVSDIYNSFSCFSKNLASKFGLTDIDGNLCSLRGKAKKKNRSVVVFKVKNLSDADWQKKVVIAPIRNTPIVQFLASCSTKIDSSSLLPRSSWSRLSNKNNN